MKFTLILGILLIIFGVVHICRPTKVHRIFISLNRNNPFLRDEKQRSARPIFIILFGVIWILVGIYIIFQ